MRYSYEIVRAAVFDGAEECRPDPLRVAGMEPGAPPLQRAMSVAREAPELRYEHSVALHAAGAQVPLPNHPREILQGA